jgi:hypothetical protein
VLLLRHALPPSVLVSEVLRQQVRAVDISLQLRTAVATASSTRCRRRLQCARYRHANFPRPWTQAAELIRQSSSLQ